MSTVAKKLPRELNFSWGNDGKPWRRDKNEDGDKDHVFAEAHVVRGFEEREDDGGHGDKKARDDGPGHLRRSIISSAIGYPIVDSFPPIFSPPSFPSAVALHTRLFTAHSTGMAEALKRIRGVVSAPGRVGVDEREALVNGLDEIEDAYRHAWQDDSDDGDDDA